LAEKFFVITSSTQHLEPSSDTVYKRAKFFMLRESGEL